MKALNWISNPAPDSLDADARAIIATIVIVLLGFVLGAWFGEAVAWTVLGTAMIFLIYKMAASGWVE